MTLAKAGYLLNIVCFVLRIVDFLMTNDVNQLFWAAIALGLAYMCHKIMEDDEKKEVK